MNESRRGGGSKLGALQPLIHQPPVVQLYLIYIKKHSLGLFSHLFPSSSFFVLGNLVCSLAGVKNSAVFLAHPGALGVYAIGNTHFVVSSHTWLILTLIRSRNYFQDTSITCLSSVVPTSVLFVYVFWRVESCLSEVRKLLSFCHQFKNMTLNQCFPFTFKSICHLSTCRLVLKWNNII